MSRAELTALVQHSYFASKDTWEQTRFAAFATLQSQSTKSIKIQDVMRFPWEDAEKEQDSKEDIAAAAERQKLVLEKLKRDGTGL